MGGVKLSYGDLGHFLGFAVNSIQFAEANNSTGTLELFHNDTNMETWELSEGAQCPMTRLKTEHYLSACVKTLSKEGWLMKAPVCWEHLELKDSDEKTEVE